MSERILEKLEPVRQRQLVLEILRYAARGLLASSFLAVGLGVWRWQTAGAMGAAALWSLAAGILLAGPVSGALIALVRGRSSRVAAAAVDREYGLKERAVSAVDFIRRGRPALNTRAPGGRRGAAS